MITSLVEMIDELPPGLPVAEGGNSIFPMTQSKPPMRTTMMNTMKKKFTLCVLLLAMTASARAGELNLYLLQVYLQN